jgi:selenocysteine-specific translation elongation factor
MTPKELNGEIATHDELIDYHLANAKRAEEVGSMQSAENSIIHAAAHSSIALALRARQSVEIVNLLTMEGMGDSTTNIITAIKTQRKNIRRILGIGGPK